MHEISEVKQQRAVIVGVDNDLERLAPSLDELELLAKTADIEVVSRLTQRLDRPHSATYIGKGKLEELVALTDMHDPDLVIFNSELSTAQMRNLSDAFDIPIIDRTLLILDIFAQGAKTAEGRIQVEIAQLKYRLSRLSGMGKMLSRLGGGIGTRGPGETKLETDRRHIAGRITNLEAKLKEIAKNRDNMRRKREKNQAFIAAFVGYTNAGKSSLMNMLSDEDLLAQDKLFATLDTTTRKLELKTRRDVLISDTVGFIERLPHHLVEAFKTTLDELRYADMLIHVVDMANPEQQRHVEVVESTLQELAVDVPTLLVLNKSDKVGHDDASPPPTSARAFKTIKTSAKTGQGKDELLSAIKGRANHG